MDGKVAFLFAGQGSQKTGMGEDFYKLDDDFKSVYDSICLDFDLKEACFVNPGNILLKTQYTQPCMVAFACGVTEILKKRGKKPDYVCGLSLGEYSALYAAGVWSLEETMTIISVRGKAMAKASCGIDTSMVAITSLGEDVVESCCKKANGAGIVSICNLNCPGQVVIGGDRRAVDIAVRYAKDAGARRCIALPVSGPFHTAYMEPAGVKLRDVLNNVSFQEPNAEVIYNYLGGPRKKDQDIKELLINQIQNTVRMQECIEYLITSDVKNYYEIGPGTVLSGFVKKTLRAMGKNEDEYNIVSINTIDDIAEL